MTRRPRLGLLARVTSIFALGALLLSSTVALATFGLAQRQLIREVEEAAEAQAFRNARVLRPNLQRILDAPEPEPPLDSSAEGDSETPSDPFSSLINQTLRPNNAQVLIIPANGQERSLSGLEKSDIPDDLRNLVLQDVPATKRFESGQAPRYAVGLRFEDLQVEYYEFVPLDDLANTLSSLRIILVGVSIGASAAGALLGYYSARRALHPVTEVSNAAEAIALGDFEARLDERADPDLHRLATSFNEMVDALRVRIERDERFASDVSHELRSPLTTLAASIEVLERRRSELSPPAQQAVDLLGKDIRRFQRLVEDLLEISRVDVGAAHLDETPVVLSDFLAFVIAQSRTPDVPLKRPRRNPEITIVADKRRLAQAITNLLDNAAKYAGGATSVGYQVIGDKVQIIIEDEGPGVAPEDRLRVFDRFTRARGDAGRRDIATGVGLGLSLVSEHIRLHDGQVWVTDRVDGSPGARFVIELPTGDLALQEEEMAL